jgi:hypothetical protein
VGADSTRVQGVQPSRSASLADAASFDDDAASLRHVHLAPQQKQLCALTSSLVAKFFRLLLF